MNRDNVEIIDKFFFIVLEAYGKKKITKEDYEIIENYIIMVRNITLEIE